MEKFIENLADYASFEVSNKQGVHILSNFLFSGIKRFFSLGVSFVFKHLSTNMFGIVIKG